MLAALFFLAAGVIANELEAPGVVAAFCDGKTGDVTYTAPTGFLIADDNSFVVSGCNGFGTLQIDDSTNITASTDCTSGKTAVVPLGVDAAKVHITSSGGSGGCGDARLTGDANDQGTYASSSCGKKNPVAPIRLVKLMPNIKAGCCQAPFSECGSGSGTAPAGYEINGKKNYLVVTGCSSSGSIVGTSISSRTDCVTGTTPAKPVGSNVQSLSIHGGGYCGEARITRVKNDPGVYSTNRGEGSNPGIILIPTSGALLETSKSVHYRPAQFLGKSEGQQNVARLKARMETLAKSVKA